MRMGLKVVTSFLPLRDKQTDMVVPNRSVARFFVPDLLNALIYMSCLAALWEPRKQGFMTGRVFLSAYRDK